MLDCREALRRNEEEKSFGISQQCHITSSLYYKSGEQRVVYYGHRLMGVCFLVEKNIET